MLILGGRYGSIEPKSQKSYIQLEYEYAAETGKPLFAVVINKNHLEERVKKSGTHVIELDHPSKLKKFRNRVCTKMVRFWSDPKDIKLAIMETMADFSNREELIGWIPSNEAINTGAVAEELASLIKENNELRAKLSQTAMAQSTYSGLSFDEMQNLLSNTYVDVTEYPQQFRDSGKGIARLLDSEEPSLYHYFLLMSKVLQRGFVDLSSELTIKFSEFNLTEWKSAENESNPNDSYLDLTETGSRFLLRLKYLGVISKAEPYIIDKVRYDLR